MMTVVEEEMDLELELLARHHNSLQEERNENQLSESTKCIICSIYLYLGRFTDGVLLRSRDVALLKSATAPPNL